jgi:hypothetical protein
MVHSNPCQVIASPHKLGSRATLTAPQASASWSTVYSMSGAQEVETRRSNPEYEIQLRCMECRHKRGRRFEPNQKEMHGRPPLALTRMSRMSVSDRRRREQRRQNPKGAAVVLCCASPGGRMPDSPTRWGQSSPGCMSISHVDASGTICQVSTCAPRIFFSCPVQCSATVRLDRT